MIQDVLMDTGPLVALFCPGEARHYWAVDQFANIRPPALTCEPVVTEACFLLARANVPPWRLLDTLESGALRIALNVEAEAGALRTLMERYRNVPMSLADACLVRLAEIHRLPVCTLDSDFTIYRVHGRTPLPLITPNA